jgi:hypothetical protein
MRVPIIPSKPLTCYVDSGPEVVIAAVGDRPPVGVPQKLPVRRARRSWPCSTRRPIKAGETGCQRTVSPFSRSRTRHWSGSRSGGRRASAPPRRQRPPHRRGHSPCCRHAVRRLPARHRHLVDHLRLASTENCRQRLCQPHQERPPGPRRGRRSSAPGPSANSAWSAPPTRRYGLTTSTSVADSSPPSLQPRKTTSRPARHQRRP